MLHVCIPFFIQALEELGPTALPTRFPAFVLGRSSRVRSSWPPRGSDHPWPAIC